MSMPECERCGYEYELRHKKEPTPYCDECAQIVAEELARELSTLEGIIQKQKEALENIKQWNSEALAFPLPTEEEMNIKALCETVEGECERALALSPSTFASRFVEREKVEPMISFLRDFIDKCEVGGARGTKAYLKAQDLLKPFSSQQPEGAGKE